MTVQIDKGGLDIERVRQEIGWEPYKALAAIIVAGVAAAGLILGVAHITAPALPPVIVNVPAQK